MPKKKETFIAISNHNKAGGARIMSCNQTIKHKAVSEINRDILGKTKKIH